MVRWPIVSRELRAASRQGSTYLLRIVAALFGITVFVGLQLQFEVPPNALGKALFDGLRLTVIAVVWVLGPLLTADCISREQREGTLKLLFLTPLRAPDIVLSKVSLQVFRAVTLLLALLPMAILPLFLGGVSWRDGLQALVVVAASMMAALSAGLVASAFTERWGRALFLSLVLSLFSVLSLIIAVTFLQTGAFPSSLKDLVSFSWLGGLIRRLSFGGMGLPSVPLTVGRDLAYVALCWTVVAVVLAAWRIKLSWRYKPPSRLRRRVVQVFCSPWLWERFFSKWMRSRRDVNPIHWLGEYSWSARLSKWSWCGAIMIAESGVLAAVVWSAQELMLWHYRLLYGLAIGLAFSAAASFRQERETGLYELLAVTPLGGRKMIAGRARGLWRQMLPAFVVLVAVFYFTTDFSEGFFLFEERGPIEEFDATLLFLFGLGTTFLTIVTIGMTLALTRLNLLMAWALTVALGLVLPLLLLGAFELGINLLGIESVARMAIEVKYVVYLAIQLVISLVVGVILLIRSLLRFAFV